MRASALHTEHLYCRHSLEVYLQHSQQYLFFSCDLYWRTIHHRQLLLRISHVLLLCAQDSHIGLSPAATCIVAISLPPATFSSCFRRFLEIELPIAMSGLHRLLEAMEAAEAGGFDRLEHSKDADVGRAASTAADVKGSSFSASCAPLHACPSDFAGNTHHAESKKQQCCAARGSLPSADVKLPVEHAAGCKALSDITNPDEGRVSPPYLKEERPTSPAHEPSAITSEQPKVVIPRAELVHPGTTASGFACPSCGRVFSKRYNAQVHMRKHTQIRPFACSICSKSFMWKSSLKSHKESHAKQLSPAAVIFKSSAPLAAPLQAPSKRPQTSRRPQASKRASKAASTRPMSGSQIPEMLLS